MGAPRYSVHMYRYRPREQSLKFIEWTDKVSLHLDSLRPVKSRRVVGVVVAIFLVAGCSKTTATPEATPPSKSDVKPSQDIEAENADQTPVTSKTTESTTPPPTDSDTTVSTSSSQTTSAQTSTTLEQSSTANRTPAAKPKWVMPTPQNSPPRNPQITIHNFSRISTADIQLWTEAATAHLNWWHTDIDAFVWPIGSEVGGPNDLSAPFNRYQVTLDEDSLGSLTNAYQEWSDNAPCLSGEHDNFGGWQNRNELAEGKRRVLGWMTSGADVATAPTPCFSSRAVTYAFPAESTIPQGQHTYLHEIYHALSSYLQEYCTEGGQTNTDRFEALRWVGEGTAHYFAYVVAAELNGTNDSIATMLEAAWRGAQGGEDLSSAESAAAALRLMVERGDLLEDDIMSARIFESCDWPDKWQGSNDSVTFAKENWQEIERSGDTWSFKDTALSQ